MGNETNQINIKSPNSSIFIMEMMDRISLSFKLKGQWNIEDLIIEFLDVNRRISKRLKQERYRLNSHF